MSKPKKYPRLLISLIYPQVSLFPPSQQATFWPIDPSRLYIVEIESSFPPLTQFIVVLMVTHTSTTCYCCSLPLPSIVGGCDCGCESGRFATSLGAQLACPSEPAYLLAYHFAAPVFVVELAAVVADISAVGVVAVAAGVVVAR